MFMAFEKKVYVKRELYKTELCRHYVLCEECPYRDKCQFAHGSEEIVDVVRHPKYKTELCKGYHSTGFCPYGPRCHFIHGDPEDVSRTSLAIRPLGSAKKQWSTSNMSGDGKEVQETNTDWQIQDQEMPTDWRYKDQELPGGWVTPVREPAVDRLVQGQELHTDWLDQDQELHVAWPNRVPKSDRDVPNALKEPSTDWPDDGMELSIDWPNPVQLPAAWPNRMGGRWKSYPSTPCSENWINQFGDIDHCRYLLKKQNLAMQSSFFSSLSQNMENHNYILPSPQSLPAVSADMEISKPTRPSCFPNQISNPSSVRKTKNWNQSYVLQNLTPNMPSDVDSFGWHHQTPTSPNVLLALSPVSEMLDRKQAFSQELISNVSSVLEIFSHNLAASSRNYISNEENCPAVDSPNRKLILSKMPQFLESLNLNYRHP